MNPHDPADDGTAPQLLRDVADINRLIIRVLTRLRLPRIEIRIDSLPAVAVQMFQQRIAQISAAPIGGLAVVLVCATIVLGFGRAWMTVHSLIWTSRQTWEYLSLIAIAALYAAVIGLGIGAISKRVRLALTLRRLRRLLVSPRAAAAPARYVGTNLHAVSSGTVAAATRDAADDVPLPHKTPRRQSRPRVILRNASDMKRILVHLFTHLKLPLVHITVDGVAPLEVQRAQHRVRQLSETCNCVLGASLAGITLLIGGFSVAWLRNLNWAWWVPESWGALGLVSVTVLCAALAGAIVEAIWIRVNLLLTLRGVRHQLAA